MSPGVALGNKIDFCVLPLRVAVFRLGHNEGGQKIKPRQNQYQSQIAQSTCRGLRSEIGGRRRKKRRCRNVHQTADESDFLHVGLPMLFEPLLVHESFSFYSKLIPLRALRSPFLDVGNFRTNRQECTHNR